MRHLILISVLFLTTGLSANFEKVADRGDIVHYSDSGEKIREYTDVTNIGIHENGSVAFDYDGSRQILNDGFKVVMDPSEVKAMASKPSTPYAPTTQRQVKVKPGIMPILIVVFVVLLGAALILLYFMKKDNEEIEA